MFLSCLLNYNGRVKINFLCTMNVTVADPAGRSYRSPAQFFSRLNLILNAYLLMYTDLLINKNYESFILSCFTCNLHICLKLTVRLRLLYSLHLFPL